MNTEPERFDMRFSLRAILVVFVCLAVGFALLFSTPNFIALPLLILVAVALPATLAAGTVYMRGTWRAFCIGGLFPSGLMLYITGWMLSLSIFEGPGRIRSVPAWVEYCDEVTLQYRVYAGSSWAMIVLIGSVVILVRHFAHRLAKYDDN